MVSELKNDPMTHTLEELESEDFAFDVWDTFVLWRYQHNERANDGEDEWSIVDQIFLNDIRWNPEEDDVPTRSDHHCYKLISKNTGNEIWLGDGDLKHDPRWKPIEEIERGDQ